MNLTCMISHFKDFKASNVNTWMYCKVSGKSKSVCVCVKNNHLNKLNTIGKEFSTFLGQLIDRKKNSSNLSPNEEIIRSYKRVNIKKILKGCTKSREHKQDGGNEEITHVRQGNEIKDGRVMGEREISHGQRCDKDNESHSHLLRNQRNEIQLGENKFHQMEEDLHWKKKLYSESLSEKRMMSSKLGHGLGIQNRREVVHEENVKDAVDELFMSKEKKKNLMKRIIFRNSYDYMELINKYESFKAKEDDNFYNCMNNPRKNSDKFSQNREDKVEQENREDSSSTTTTTSLSIDDTYLYEVETDTNNDPNMNIDNYMECGFPTNTNLNISIFSEVGKRDILESCKRKKSMQSEINKNSDSKNIFNNDIYFWLKRKVHRSVGWQLTPISLGKSQDIIDVTNLNFAKTNSQMNDFSEGTEKDSNMENKSVKNQNFSNNGEDNPFDKVHVEEAKVVEKRPGRMTYLERRAAPANFLSKICVKGVNERDNIVQRCIDEVRSGENICPGEVKGGENICPGEVRSGENVCPKEETESAYEGIIHNSKNVFRKIRENYEIFKKEKLSPHIIEGCEKYINYYYGIEKEEKVKEMRKYAELNFYDIIKDENFDIDNYNMFIKSKILFNKEEEAFQYFNLLKKYDFKINVETYNSLMYTCIVQKNAKLGRLIYLQMIKDFISPNKNTYCILIKAHILDNDIKSAFHLYRKMIKEEIEVDLPIYSTLIDGLLKHKYYQRAESFFNYIINYKNVTPDEILYTIMIKKCAYNAEAEKCLNYYDTMISSNMRITDITLIEIINCLSKRNDYFHKVFHFYNIYLANDMKLNHRLMLYMIIACSTSGNIKRLKEILKTMNRHKIKITQEMCAYIIRAFANNCQKEGITLSEKHNNIKYAWAVVSEVNNLNWISKSKSVDTTKMLNSIVLLYINCDYYDYAISMLKYYTHFKCCPDGYTFRMLYKMLFFQLHDYGKVLCLYDHMINHTDIKADEYTFNLVLSAAIKTKSSKNTLFVLRHMYSAKIYPTQKAIKELFHVGRHITEIQVLINSMINQQKKVIYEENLKDNQLIQLNIDEYELNLFKEGKTFKTKSTLDQVRNQFFNRKQRIEKEKRMSKNKKSSDWLPYGQYLQHKRKGGESYAKRVDRPKPLPFD
ncbi:hypothetical protein, conserved [Plasmodium gonderi]|uniref:Pentatricopeptide repeat domain-containing protein n=1 Tax=Plasmodium gonderi TaxID=77519 RepID=A0A1Y1JMK8_PLAGO|nr:hypothetical protein, conserved [Plasmodium gonderi]GAW83709.1 hypothetical protein, conserved [Plasmodium gonderi]